MLGSAFGDHVGLPSMRRGGYAVSWEGKEGLGGIINQGVRAA